SPIQAGPTPAMATVIRAVTAFSVSRCIAARSRTTHQPSRVITPLAPFQLLPLPPNRLRWPRWLWRYCRRCWWLGRRSGRCLAQMLRYDACTLRALSGDLQGEVGQLLGRQPQRTGAEVGTRAAVGVRIFQHVREVGHGANFSTARPLPRRSPARSLWPFLARCAFAAWPDLGDRRSRMVR